MLLRFLGRASALALTIAALQLLVAAVQPMSVELQEVRALPARGVDVVFLGDSSVPPERGSLLSTADLLQADLPGHRVGLIAHLAYHAGVYVAYARALEASAYRPKYLFVPINLRSFSVSWDRRPEYEFTSTIFALEHPGLVGRAIHHPLRVFKALDPPAGANDAFDSLTALDGDVPLGTMKELAGPEYAVATEEHSRRIAAVHYMYTLRPDHRRVVQLASLAGRLRAQHIEPIFYVTPVDHQACSALLGGRFEARIAANIEVLKRELAAQHVELVDLSHLLDSSLFHWRAELYPNEHLVEEGRRRVAARLADRVRD